MLAGLLLVVATLVTLARVMSVPYPIFLVLGGLAIGFVPGLPDVALDPELVLLIFLPPLLYSSAFFASLRDLRRNVGPISLLSVGLVLLTCGAVAVVVHAVVPGMSCSAPSSPRPTRSRRRRSPAGSACRAASSSSWRANR